MTSDITAARPVAGRPRDDDLPDLPEPTSPPPGASATAAPPAARPRSAAATKTRPAAHHPGRPTPTRLHHLRMPRLRQRLHGEQRCPDCGIFARRIGIGGPCPHCDEPVALTDLLDQEVAINPNR